MGWFMRGALVEYDGTDFMGSTSNKVNFQFNPETISRTINIPEDASATPKHTGQEEPNQTSSAPIETFSIIAHFSAADALGHESAPDTPSRRFGIGPQLAALEKMIYTKGGIASEADGAAVDTIGDDLKSGGNAKQPVPRQETPRILFIWGSSRVLPVKITSMTIDEEKYDPKLNPVQAKVTIGLAVLSFPEKSQDKVGLGALSYTQKVKDDQAELNRKSAAKLDITDAAIREIQKITF